MGDRTHAAQWHQRQARGCATELSYHYKLQGNDVAVSASDDSQARRWGVVVCHRRFGKTVWAINHILRDALMSSKPAPRYAMMAPTCRQAKSVSWDFLNGLNIKLEKRVVSMCRND